MNAIFLLAVGFGGIIVIGTLLVAVHDALTGFVAPASRSEAARPRPTSVAVWPSHRHHRLQFEGGGTPSARAKMYSTAAANPAGRVSRCRAPGTFT
jgi:hypothetical protein